MSTGTVQANSNPYIAENYQSPWGTEKEGLYSLPKETMTKIFNELDPASQTAASFTTRAFKEIHPPEKPFDSFFSEDAAQEGHWSLILWGIENNYCPDDICIKWIISKGNLALLMTIDNQCPGRVTADYAEEAVLHDRFNILQWLFEKFSAKILNSKVFNTAMRHSSLDILNWLKEKGCPTHYEMFHNWRLLAEKSKEWLFKYYDYKTGKPK